MCVCVQSHARAIAHPHLLTQKGREGGREGGREKREAAGTLATRTFLSSSALYFK